METFLADISVAEFLIAAGLLALFYWKIVSPWIHKRVKEEALSDTVSLIREQFKSHELECEKRHESIHAKIKSLEEALHSRVDSVKEDLHENRTRVAVLNTTVEAVKQEMHGIHKKTDSILMHHNQE